MNEKPQSSGMAIASLFLGVLGLLAVFLDLLASIGSSGFSPRPEASLLYSPAMILGVLLGHAALRQIRRDDVPLSGRALAGSGLIVGYTALLAGLAVLYIPERVQFSRSQRELPARVCLERVNWAAKKVHDAYPDRGYPRSFEELDLNPDKYESFSATLQWGSSTGYTFTYTPVTATDGPVAAYRVVARPPAGSKLHQFSSDQSGVIRQEGIP
jgi:hypothetical protein